MTTGFGLIAVTVGHTAEYVCTRPGGCPVADEYGDTLLGLPGRTYTCECGAAMVEQAPAPTSKDS